MSDIEGGFFMGLTVIIFGVLVIGLSSGIGYSNGYADGKRQSLTSAQLKLDAIEQILEGR